MKIEWINAEEAPPTEHGKEWLVTAETEEGPVVTAAEYDLGDKWLYGGEATYCLPYFFNVTHYAAMPEPAEKLQREG